MVLIIAVFWCNKADKIQLSQSLIRTHSLLAFCNSSPLFWSHSCLSSSLPSFHDCFASHDDIALIMRVEGKKRRKRKRNQACPASASSAFFFYDSPPHTLFSNTFSSLTPPPIVYSHFLHIWNTRTHTQTHIFSAHDATLSHLCKHNSAMKESSVAPSLRNQQLWDNSVTNKVKGRALWWLKLKRYFIIFCVCVCVDACVYVCWGQGGI